MRGGKSALTQRHTAQDENPLKVDHKLKHTVKCHYQAFPTAVCQTLTFWDCVKLRGRLNIGSSVIPADNSIL